MLVLIVHKIANNCLCGLVHQGAWWVKGAWFRNYCCVQVMWVNQQEPEILLSSVAGRVYYRALVHFAHLLWVLSAFTLSDPAELSALKVPGWHTRNGKLMKWKMRVTTRTKRAPSWLRSGRGGALSAAFHKKSTFILAGLVSRVSRADLCPSLPP